ncbi:hypothetical protein GW17_00025612, partial [Ensete ventricosum]
DWLRFSVAFWHTFRGTGADPFGAPTKSWPWEDGTNSVAMAKRRSKIMLFQLVSFTFCRQDFFKLLLITRRRLGLMSTFNILNYSIIHDCFCHTPGTLLIEPKPQEPTKHQYVLQLTVMVYDIKYQWLFLGCSCHHELETARINGLLGNIDANAGDPQIGMCKYPLKELEATNLFSLFIRRESTDVEDMFIAHISGMDTLARGLRNVKKLTEELAEMIFQSSL